LAGASVNCHADVKYNGKALDAESLGVRTGKDGHFRIEGLTAGQKYELYAIKRSRLLDIAGGAPKNLMLKPGETKDLGDIKIKPQE
jgi:hypothetical protein